MTADNNRMNRSRACGRTRTSMNNRPDSVIPDVIRLRIWFNWLRFRTARLDHAAVPENEGR